MRSIRPFARRVDSGRPEQIEGDCVREVAELYREPIPDLDVFFLLMSLLPRKGLLAIAAVVDVALQTDGRPIAAKTLATRHGLPPRHLESVLQSLVRVGILKGIRGPRGGYELARERRRITTDDILRAAGTIEDAGDPIAAAGSALLNEVVIPAVGQAERAFSIALGRINLDDLVRKAESLPNVVA